MECVWVERKKGKIWTKFKISAFRWKVASSRVKPNENNSHKEKVSDGGWLVVEIGTMKLIYQTVKRIAVGLINQFDGSLIYLGQKSLCAGVW